MIVKKRSDGMLSIIATSGQSIYDLCLMTYGDLKYVYKLIQDSKIVSLNEPTLSGKEIIFDPMLVQDSLFYNALLRSGVVINTLSEQTQDKPLFLLQENRFYLLQENGFKIKL
jgi:hypothetical protein